MTRGKAQRKLARFCKENISLTMWAWLFDIPLVKKHGQEKHSSEQSWMLWPHSRPAGFTISTKNEHKNVAKRQHRIPLNFNLSPLALYFCP